MTDLKQLVAEIRQAVSELNRRVSLPDALMAVLAVLVGVYLHWPIVTALMLGAFIWVMLQPISSQLLAEVTLGALFLVALFLFANRADRAETIAALAYYLLAITVVVILREWRQQE